MDGEDCCDFFGDPTERDWAHKFDDCTLQRIRRARSDSDEEEKEGEPFPDPTVPETLPFMFRSRSLRYLPLSPEWKMSDDRSHVSVRLDFGSYPAPHPHGPARIDGVTRSDLKTYFSTFGLKHSVVDDTRGLPDRVDLILRAVSWKSWLTALECRFEALDEMPELWFHYVIRDHQINDTDRCCPTLGMVSGPLVCQRSSDSGCVVFTSPESFLIPNSEEKFSFRMKADGDNELMIGLSLELRFALSAQDDPLLRLNELRRKFTNSSLECRTNMIYGHPDSRLVETLHSRICHIATPEHVIIGERILSRDLFRHLDECLTTLMKTCFTYGPNGTLRHRQVTKEIDTETIEPYEPSEIEIEVIPPAPTLVVRRPKFPLLTVDELDKNFAGANEKYASLVQAFNAEPATVLQPWILISPSCRENEALVWDGQSLSCHSPELYAETARQFMLTDPAGIGLLHDARSYLNDNIEIQLQRAEREQLQMIVGTA